MSWSKNAISYDREKGKCSSIPQLSPSEVRRVDASKAKVESFPVHITQDILWGFVPLPEGQASSYPKLPEEVMPILKSNNITFKARDLPYSFDYLVENFMDPGAPALPAMPALRALRASRCVTTATCNRRLILMY